MTTEQATATEPATADRPQSRFFRARVTAITDLTPSFRRFTFGGEDLADDGDPGFDQRIKIVFPTSDISIDDMPTADDWWDRWRALDDAERPPFRTYTTRAVRRAACEVDVDMVAHDVLGPASEWIARAEVGDEVLIFAPTTAHTAVSYGIDFVPPARTDDILLAGDETAAPAIAVILEQLPRTARGVVVLETPDPADAAYLPEHPGFVYRVAARRDDADRHPTPHRRRHRGGRDARPGGTRQRGRGDRHRRRHPVGGAAHRQGRRDAEERRALCVARR